MKELNRRSVLTGAVAASAAGALTPLATAPAFAAAPPVGKQAAGYYRYKVGTTEVTVVTDGVNRFKFPDTFVVNKNRDEVNAAWTALFQEKDMMVVPYSPIAVNTGSKLIVIDSWHRRGQLRTHQGCGRPVPLQPQSFRHRSQPGRRRHHLALPRRPH